MIALLIVIILFLLTLVWYFREKAQEFERLFELSKSYDGLHGQTYKEIEDLLVASVGIISSNRPIKFNKDGSIAKKRGRKPRA
jgi:hypothetical protein